MKVDKNYKCNIALKKTWMKSNDNASKPTLINMTNSFATWQFGRDLFLNKNYAIVPFQVTVYSMGQF